MKNIRMKRVVLACTLFLGLLVAVSAYCSVPLFLNQEGSWVLGDSGYSIRPEHFASDGQVYANGIVDDSALVQAAIDSCPETGGCEIHFSRNPWTISDNITVPSNVYFTFQNGSTLGGTSGKKISFDFPNQINAGRHRIFADNATIVFTNPGTVQADWWGADNTGAADAYDELTAAIAAIPAGSTLAFSPGTYLVDNSLSITKGISITCPSGEATTLSAGTNMTDKSMFVYTAAQPNADLRRIENCRLDGNSVALNGFEVKQAYGLTFQDVKAFEFLGAGFLMNGDADAVTPTYGGYIYNINFINCASNSNRFGYHLWKNRNHTAFEAFNFWGSGAYSCTDAGLWVHGDNATTKPTGPGALTGTRTSGLSANWYGGQVESSTTTAIKVTNAGRLTISGCYIEPASGIGFSLDNHAFVELNGGHGPYDNSVFSDNSTMCLSGTITSVAYNSRDSISTRRQCIGDLISDKTDYGPPSWGRSAFTSSGYWWFKGMTLIDGQGTPWMSLGDRSLTGDSGKNRWTPINGRIVIPFDYTHMDAGYWLAFWSEADFVVTQVDFIVDDNFTATEDNPGYCAGAGVNIGIKIGTTTYQEKFISNTQGAIANLVSGAVIRGTDNNATGNVLGNHKAYFMNGVAYSDIGADWDTIYDQSYIYVYSCPDGGSTGDKGGTWTAGKGWIVITGYPLEYN